MTEFVLDGFSCRAEGSGDVLVMLFSGFDEQLFARSAGLFRTAAAFSRSLAK